MEKKIAFQAYSSGGLRVTRDTPREAAEAFFAQYPTKRKCDVAEGVRDGGFFSRSYNLREGTRPRIWEGVTKKMVSELPS